MDPRWKHPFTCIVAGPTSSGKTYFVINLLKHVKEMINPPPQKIFWFYGEWQELYSRLQIENLAFHEGLPSDDFLDPSVRNLIIIDDLLTETDARVTNLFDKNKENRTISLNAHYMVLFKSPRDVMQVEHLARQMFPGNTKFMREAFADATVKPFSYLLIDLKPDTPDHLRLRSKIFPGELHTVYIKK